MKPASVLAIVTLTVAPAVSRGEQGLDQVQKMEAAGDVSSARAALAHAVESAPNNVTALTNYAEFLERYGDPACHEVYAKLLAQLRQSRATARAGVIASRMVKLDLLAGDRAAASRDADAYRAATGKTLALPAESAPAPPPNRATVPVLGPLRSFARMAAISSDAVPEDILPALARNVVTNGYQAAHNNEGLEQTEYLKLVHRYISQARELDKLAGDSKVIKIENCESANVAELLRILGVRMRGGCGSEVVLETVNAARAFLTADSGFPVSKLEEALRTNRPFSYDFHPTPVPVLFGADYWFGAKGQDVNDFMENFISDPAQCRLYLGLSKLDRQTAEDLRKAIPYTRLKVYSHVLDFFGGMFEIRNGKAMTPGGARSAAAWGDLAGASPDKGTEFYDKLISKDDGWMASLYDALARIHGPLQDYLTEPARMKRFYTAVRGRITSPGPARPVFRSNADMMLLTTRLRLEPDGKPHIPGSLEVWKTLFTNHPQGKYDGKLTRLATTWKEPDDVIEALFALCRKSVENEPLKIFMAISDIDRNRAKPLDAATVDRLARSYHEYGNQYPVFSESRSLSDKSILQFLDTAEAVTHLRDMLFKADAAGSFQSLVGLWQILVRQQIIPDTEADSTFAAITGSFAQVHNYRELFDAGRENIKRLLAAAPESSPAKPQERLVALLAGGAHPGSDTADSDAREQLSQELLRILEAQRIISLDTLFDLADNLEGVSKGAKLNTTLVNRLAGSISEIQLPRAPLTAVEQNAMGFGYWTDRHIDAERKLNVRAAIEKAAGDAEKLKDVRAQLAPSLRDTLLAFNYAYYAPPGAQVLYTNPVFVRSHDFLGTQGSVNTWRTTEVYGTGWPSNAGGRLVGSLSALPYALAEAEQNFLVPTQTQALIWGDLVPQMILSAKIPRWWNVTPSQVHWVGLHLRYGRELLAEAALDDQVRGQVLDSLAQMASPARTGEVGALLARGAVKDAVDHVTPSELFTLARDLAPKRAGDDSPVLAELRHLSDGSTNELTYAGISRAFGTPKPTLANSYEPELLNLRTFPTLMGYSSRIMAESWESNTLYWAALADELSLTPGQLNVRIPEWTGKLVEEIFASHLEDWPALLKSLRQVGDEVRAQSRAAGGETKAEPQGYQDR
ncbi:MAG TPA: hypothetical protein VLY04_15540 [Bryobacteraceae bacterium]|nr:hypothetical protein [Bryobacteraceae bacterium]